MIAMNDSLIMLSHSALRFIFHLRKFIYLRVQKLINRSYQCNIAYRSHWQFRIACVSWTDRKYDSSRASVS